MKLNRREKARRVHRLARYYSVCPVSADRVFILNGLFERALTWCWKLETAICGRCPLDRGDPRTDMEGPQRPRALSFSTNKTYETPKLPLSTREILSAPGQSFLVHWDL